MRPSDTALRRLLGVVVILHGIAHLAGTADAFDRAADGRAAEYLGGLATIDDPAALRGIGAMWAMAGLLVAGAGVVVARGAASWPAVLAAAAGGSLMLCVAALWAAAIGVVVNVALLAVALASVARAAPRRP